MMPLPPWLTTALESGQELSAARSSRMGRRQGSDADGYDVSFAARQPADIPCRRSFANDDWHSWSRADRRNHP